MRSLLLLLISMLPALSFGQTYFYINSIDVVPGSPTTQDAIQLHISGDLSSSGSYISDVEVDLDGFTLHVTIHAGDNGGLAVLVPYTEVVPIGMLAAGDYTIHLMGSFILDGAPVPDHHFTVTDGGGGSDCDDVMITSILFNAFNDTLIDVRVINNSGNIFSYPGFILFDALGDTVAVETVDLFGIGETSTHHLKIHDDADLTMTAFTGTLELWTGFYSDLVCTFPVQVDLCPEVDCIGFVAYVINLGGATAVGDFEWTIGNSFGVVEEGIFTLSDSVEYASETFCLAPGIYTMTMTNGSSQGAPWMGVTIPGSLSGPQTPLTQPVEEMTFAFYIGCAPDFPQSVASIPASELVVMQDAAHLMIGRSDGEPLNAVMLYDMRGGIAYENSVRADVQRIPLAGLSAGIYLVKAIQADGMPLMQKVLIAR